MENKFNFKVGDEVVCIDPTGINRLVRNRIYKIKRIESGEENVFIYISEDFPPSQDGYYAHRFIPNILAARILYGVK